MNFSYQLGRTPLFFKKEIKKKEQEEEQAKKQENDNETSNNETLQLSLKAMPLVMNGNKLLGQYLDVMSDYNKPISLGNTASTGIVTETEDSEEKYSALPEDLAEAIESGILSKIKAELDKLGIAYETTKNTSEEKSLGYIITFSYNGQDYEIPCIDIAYQPVNLDNTDSSESAGNSTTMHYRDFTLKNMGFTKDQINQYFDKVETQKQGQLGGTYYVLRSDLQISVTNDEGITSLKTITSAEELKECLDNKTDIKSLPENLVEAINTGDVTTIINELAEMNISYGTSPEPGKAQVYKIVTFNYEGKNYEIHCKNTNIEMNTQPLDTSVEGQLKSIVKALENGNRQKLEQLDELGIAYDIRENADGGYTVTFNYEGIDYEATYTPVKTSEPGAEQKPTLLEINTLIKFGNLEAAYAKLEELGIEYETTVNEDGTTVVTLLINDAEISINVMSGMTQAIDENIDTAYSIFDQVSERKQELLAHVSDVLANDGTLFNETGYSDREMDTFVDSVITEVVKNNPDDDIETLMSKIKDEISDKILTDPDIIFDINRSLINTDDYLLSDEEKALKADLLAIELDSDPDKIDGGNFDFSVMPDSEKTVSGMTSDWDMSTVEGALECKNPYPYQYDENSDTVKLFQNLEELKPQLKDYIKQQLEAQGLQYNEAAVDKYLNYFMTETVREGIQAKYHDAMPDIYPDTVLSSNATIEDLGEYLVSKVNEELAEGANAFSTNWASDDVDPLLTSTSDYFLTPEERQKKQDMINARAGL